MSKGSKVFVGVYSTTSARVQFRLEQIVSTKEREVFVSLSRVAKEESDIPVTDRNVSFEMFLDSKNLQRGE